MRLFHKRPLSLILCVMLGGFSLFYGIPLGIKIIVGATSLLYLVAMLLLPGLRPANAVLLIAASVTAAAFFSAIYFDGVFFPNELYGEEATVEAKVVDVDGSSDTHRELIIKTQSINGKRARYKFKLYLYDESREIDAGAEITFTSKILDFAKTDTLDYKNYYTSRGISARVSATEITSHEDGRAPLGYKFKEMRTRLTEYAARITDGDTAGLLSALLLGERERLPGSTERDYMRLGITHILSLGGFHLAILMGGLNILLWRTGKRLRTVVGCIFCFLFMLFCGFPLTVVRAGFMLIFSSVLMMTVGMSDSITSLFVSSAIIVAIQPYSALDLGFWLSVLATVGIIVASEETNERTFGRTGIYRLTAKLTSAITFSVLAIASTSLLTARSFTGISMIAIPSTVIFSLLLNAYIYCGIAVLAFGLVFPSVGGILVKFQSILTDITTSISYKSWIYVSSDFEVVKRLSAVLAVLFAVLILFRLKKRYILIGAMTLTYATMLLMAYISANRAVSMDSTVGYSIDGDRIIITGNDKETAVIDASGLSNDDAYLTRYLLEGDHLTEITHYVIPAYSKSAPTSIAVILGRVTVRNLYLPEPYTDEESELLEKIEEVAETYRVNVYIHSPDTEIDIGEHTVAVTERNYVKNAFIIALRKDNETVTYFSRGALEYCAAARGCLYSSDTVIFGATGPQYSNIFAVDEYGSDLSRVIVSQGSIYFDTRFMENTPDIITDSKYYLFD